MAEEEDAWIFLTFHSHPTYSPVSMRHIGIRFARDAVRSDSKKELKILCWHSVSLGILGFCTWYLGMEKKVCVELLIKRWWPEIKMISQTSFSPAIVYYFSCLSWRMWQGLHHPRYDIHIFRKTIFYLVSITQRFSSNLISGVPVMESLNFSVRKFQSLSGLRSI